MYSLPIVFVLQYSFVQIAFEMYLFKMQIFGSQIFAGCKFLVPKFLYKNMVYFQQNQFKWHYNLYTLFIVLDELKQIDKYDRTGVILGMKKP